MCMHRALLPISQKFPGRFPWNSSNIGMIDYDIFSSFPGRSTNTFPFSVSLLKAKYTENQTHVVTTEMPLVWVSIPWKTRTWCDSWRTRMCFLSVPSATFLKSKRIVPPLGCFHSAPGNTNWISNKDKRLLTSLMYGCFNCMSDNSFILLFWWHSTTLPPLLSVLILILQISSFFLSKTSDRPKGQSFWKELVHDLFNTRLHSFGIHYLWKSASARLCRFLNPS